MIVVSIQSNLRERRCCVEEAKGVAKKKMLFVRKVKAPVLNK
jgi:hypothetical protein